MSDILKILRSLLQTNGKRSKSTTVITSTVHSVEVKKHKHDGLMELLYPFINY